MAGWPVQAAGKSRLIGPRRSRESLTPFLRVARRVEDAIDRSAAIAAPHPALDLLPGQTRGWVF